MLGRGGGVRGVGGGVGGLRSGGEGSVDGERQRQGALRPDKPPIKDELCPPSLSWVMSLRSVGGA